MALLILARYALAAGALAYLSIGWWRIQRGDVLLRPHVERRALAILVLFVGLHAARWLLAV